MMACPLVSARVPWCPEVLTVKTARLNTAYSADNDNIPQRRRKRGIAGGGYALRAALTVQRAPNYIHKAMPPYTANPPRECL